MTDKELLIVDDDEKILKYLSLELNTAGYQVKTAASAQEALAHIRRAAPDLILMDMMLPDMTGADAVRQLKADAATRHIPVLFLTAMLTKQEEEKHLQMNVDEAWYPAIAKPFEQKVLLSAVAAALKKGL